MKVAAGLSVLSGFLTASAAYATTPTYVQRLFGQAPLGLRDFVVDSQGNTYIADGNSAVVRFDSSGLAAPFPIPIAGLLQPDQIALGKDGTIYVSTIYEIL